MLKNIFRNLASSRLLLKSNQPSLPITKRLLSDTNDKDELLLRRDLKLPGVFLDEVDNIMSDGIIESENEFYPHLLKQTSEDNRLRGGHNLMVIQPWVSYANFGEGTDPQLQLDECVSLGNTLHNWKVIDQRIVFANQLNRKQLMGPKAFEELKETIQSKVNLSAIFFGVELLSAIQFSTLEKELKMAVYDRFTVVLNIFRQHARTKEAKLQLALAELPYIRSHLREIHESSEFSSCAESLKTLVGGTEERHYHQRLRILKRRESKLKYLLEEVMRQRDSNKKLRRKGAIPSVSVVGYTNCGKTTLIKYLTGDERLQPKDQLFATLDVSTHIGNLPSNKTVFFIDTVGFISRVPKLLVEAFSATLKDIQESNLIIHVLDVAHPDYRIHYTTVKAALESLRIPKNLLETRITIGNKLDLIDYDKPPKDLPKCDLSISATKGTNLAQLVEMVDQRLMSNLGHQVFVIRTENGGKKYNWLRLYATILECKADETDGNYLWCRVTMSPASAGRWRKQFGALETSE